ncbi:hypothetical protein P5673_009857 [Acropora cervicornis]|uniref:Uncharacterized protein n=1 Tax=Acropora cervicornis TaxID=6130 RepID=A0AAD9V9Y4_ACRCE|nr:hypothetical protein P5673_009857 [Acropora cervicornis]
MAASDDQVQKSKNASKKCFCNKERSPARALAWEAVVDSLNEIHSPKFQLKDKKAVRERWNLLRKKFSKKMSEEEKASALVGREDTIHAKAESASKQHLKDNETAEEIRKKAMESLKETKKRNSDEGGASPKRRKSRRAEPLVDFLREKAAADREIRQQELRAKQQEQPVLRITSPDHLEESQQQMMKAMILQQQQMNTAFLTVLKELLDK